MREVITHATKHMATVDNTEIELNALATNFITKIFIIKNHIIDGWVNQDLNGK